MSITEKNVQIDHATFPPSRSRLVVKSHPTRNLEEKKKRKKKKKAAFGGITHDHDARSAFSFRGCQSMYQEEPNALKTTLFGFEERAQSRLQCGFCVKH